MRRYTTSAATDPARLAAVLVTELICALLLVGGPHPAPAPPVAAAPAPLPARESAPLPADTYPGTETLADGRTVHLVGLGGARTASLLARIGGQMNDAAQAVTTFWGPDWPRDVLIVAAGTDAEFGTLAGGGADIAATTTAQRIMFAPGAATMSAASLRIVLRHELFHYASRAVTAADAPRWLTEGVADFVGRPPVPRPHDGSLARLPTDAELSAPGAAGSSAYDRAWWFSRFVADAYGTAQLRALYVRACGPGHPDAATAVHDALGADLPTVLVRWRQWLTG
jgi:hypothetical protein